MSTQDETLMFPEREIQQRQELNSLFEKWRGQLDKKQAGGFVRDGFYPYYFRQKCRILFIGREARDIEGQDYLKVLLKAYREGKVGGRSLNRTQFHARKLYVAWGLLNGMINWDDMPYATEIAETFATANGISFAFMNVSKSSNESGKWPSNWDKISASCRAANLKIQEEIAFLKPHIVISMNLMGWLDSLGTRNTIRKHDDVNSYHLNSNGHQSLLLDTHHFTAFKRGEHHFYNPIRDAINAAIPMLDQKLASKMRAL